MEVRIVQTVPKLPTTNVLARLHCGVENAVVPATADRTMVGMLKAKCILRYRNSAN